VEISKEAEVHPEEEEEDLDLEVIALNKDLPPMSFPMALSSINPKTVLW
jgi:hypothetical protein